jgi:hypothetical protein
MPVAPARLSTIFSEVRAGVHVAQAWSAAQNSPTFRKKISRLP